MKNSLTWFRLFDTDAVANLPYVEKQFKLEGYGLTTVRICKGVNHYAIALPEEGLYLPAGLNNRVPFLTRDNKFGAVVDAQGFLCLGVQL